MTSRAQHWFKEAKAAGMDSILARLGGDVIDSWESFWQHQISKENMRQMLSFGISNPDAALHRWALLAGPCPWFPSEEEEKKALLRDPRYAPTPTVVGKEANQSSQPTRFARG
jgi:hypothetical protein